MDLTPEELLLAQLVRLAIRDARQARNERLRYEARRWLWSFAPNIAARAGLSAGDRFMNKDTEMVNKMAH